MTNEAFPTMALLLDPDSIRMVVPFPMLPTTVCTLEPELRIIAFPLLTKSPFPTMILFDEPVRMPAPEKEPVVRIRRQFITWFALWIQSLLVPFVWLRVSVQDSIKSPPCIIAVLKAL